MKLLLVLVACVAWFVSARATLRGRHTAAEVAVAAALHAPVILLIAYLLPGWVWKVLVPMYLLLPHWVVPFGLVKRRMRGAAEMVPFTGEGEDAPRAAAAAVAQRGEVLQGAGFTYLGTWVEPHNNLRIVRACYEHPETREFATVSSLLGETTPQTGVLVTRITVALDDERKLRVSDQAAAGVPGMRAWYLPTVHQPERLLAVLRALRTRDHPLARAVPVYPPGESIEAFFRRETAEAYEHSARSGKYRRVEDGMYTFTVRGAVLASAQLMFPAAQLRELWARARERALLRRLGVPATDPRAVPRIPDSSRAAREAGALAVIAILLLPLPEHLGGAGFSARSLAAGAGDTGRPERLPADFTVPADYPGAVRALERLAGASATPLVLEDVETGAPVRTGAFAVPVPARRAGGLLDAAAPLFRARGFMLFRHDQTFGIGGAPETLALYPRYDPYGVMRMVGTNGDNYGIGTDGVAHWLAALEREYPFTITGIGYDEVEGRFDRPLTRAQAAGVAKRVYAFCPDVVDQGTRTVRALEAEIRDRRTLYCWWD
ncbi:MAG TPA: DUF4253 domain-containing protein [Longimicrobium sp.]|nr:DUF4253 domain-containing protein [Longimicrobium sp.]